MTWISSLQYAVLSLVLWLPSYQALPVPQPGSQEGARWQDVVAQSLAEMEEMLDEQQRLQEKLSEQLRSSQEESQELERRLEGSQRESQELRTLSEDLRRSTEDLGSRLQDSERLSERLQRRIPWIRAAWGTGGTVLGFLLGFLLKSLIPGI